MFELVAVVEPVEGSCGRLPGIVDVDDDAWVFDEARWDALLADAPPFDVSPVAPPPEPGFADCAPSGWLALELDIGTGDAAVLSDAALIDGIVGFDRLGS